jgi:hypothetical protein
LRWRALAPIHPTSSPTDSSDGTGGHRGPDLDRRQVALALPPRLAIRRALRREQHVHPLDPDRQPKSRNFNRRVCAANRFVLSRSPW